VDGTGGCWVNFLIGDLCLIRVADLWEFQWQKINQSQSEDIVDHVTIKFSQVPQAVQVVGHQVELMLLDEKDYHIVKM
jgi:hypothetical protein